MENIFHGVKARLDEEEITELLSRPGIRIERIVSTGQASPPDYWYDQPADEWVILLTGSAALQIEGEAEMPLEPGDHVFLPAHKRHRVTRTNPAIQPRTLRHVQDELLSHGVKMFGVQLHEREAFRAVFSFGGTLETLDPDNVGNIEKAIINARAFAGEAVAMLKEAGAGQGDQTKAEVAR